MTTPGGPSVVRNQLLAAVPFQEYVAISPHIEQITLRAGDVLLEQDAVIPFVYFPEDIRGVSGHSPG